MSHLSESSQISNPLQRDSRSSVDLDELFRATYTPLHRYCLGLTGDGDAAHDAAQEAFMRMARNQVKGKPAALRVWLFKVATHIIRDRYRVDKNRERLLSENPPLTDHVAGPDACVQQNETIAEVRTTLAQMAPRDRQLLLLRYQSFSYKEMAAMLNVAPSSVGTLLARAQRRFAKLHTGIPSHD